MQHFFVSEKMIISFQEMFFFERTAMGHVRNIFDEMYTAQANIIRTAYREREIKNLGEDPKVAVKALASWRLCYPVNGNPEKDIEYGKEMLAVLKTDQRLCPSMHGIVAHAIQTLRISNDLWFDQF